MTKQNGFSPSRSSTAFGIYLYSKRYYVIRANSDSIECYRFCHLWFSHSLLKHPCLFWSTNNTWKPFWFSTWYGYAEQKILHTQFPWQHSINIKQKLREAFKENHPIIYTLSGMHSKLIVSNRQNHLNNENSVVKN